MIKDKGKDRVKVYILCIVCLWSRSINLIYCRDLSVDTFLRALSLHVFAHGMPEACHSDLGSQIVAGANVIADFLKDENSLEYFKEKGIKPLIFSQFPKGCKELGGIVEICVKQVKKLIYGSLGKNVLNRDDFEYLIYHTVSLVNKRPIAFKESLCSDDQLDMSPLTPEIVIHGHELPTLNLVPQLQAVDIDPSWYDNLSSPVQINDKFYKLAKVRQRLIELYNDEFVGNLITQATNQPGRYLPVKNEILNVGDIVLLKEDNTKRINYPMGRIVSRSVNYMGEVTEVRVLKGATREEVRRHPNAVILILSINDDPNLTVVSPDNIEEKPESTIKEPKVRRRAAVESEERTKKLFLI